MDIDAFLHAMPEVAQEEIVKRGINAVSIGEGVNRWAISGHDQGVAYFFKKDLIYNPTKSETEGYEVFDEMEQVYRIIDRKNIIPAPIKMLPRELLTFNRDGVCIGGKYKDSYLNWKNGLTAPGTSLRKWDVLSDSEVASLEADGIFTIEQYAEYPRDRLTSRYPQSFIDAHVRAGQWVAGKEMRAKAGEQATKMAELEALNKDLAERLAKLETGQVVKAGKKKGVKNKLLEK